MPRFIDFVALMLLNMAAGFGVLAFFLLMALAAGDRKRWVAPLAMVGLVAIVCGFRMIFTWPLPGSYNGAYGEMSVLLGAIYLGIALSLAKDWNLAPIAIYGIPAGVAAVVVGFRIMSLGMTNAPQLSAIGFILSGLGGILAVLAFCAPGSKALRSSGAIALLLAAAIWLMTAYPAYWIHMKGFSTWTPSTMAAQPPPAEKMKAPEPPPRTPPPPPSEK